MATEAYCNWQACKLRVAAGLHTAATDLPPSYDDIISQSVLDASSHIKRIFILKGYTPGDISASDDIRVWAEMLGAFFSFQRLVGIASYDLAAVEHLDCRKDFVDAGALVVNGVAIAPSANATAIGGVNFGTLSSVASAECQYARIRGGRRGY